MNKTPLVIDTNDKKVRETILEKDRLDLMGKIMREEIEQNGRLVDYWHEFSNLFYWQTWIVIAMFVFPLIVLILFIDRKRALQLGFYGYSVHIFFTYTDIIATERGLWIYPFKLLPLLPSSITLDASFVPVVYMLYYQFIINTKKNYYIWMLPLCLVLAFILKPTMVGLGLFHFRGKENFLLLLAGYAFVALISKWLTDFFILLGKTKKWSFRHK
ncbi:CBO0543 family protein [Bacillus infantis]|uniref:CBO0543 family protein n=1 Tax=Bacillus infantis TaxID=324767 RepID=UPI00301978FA